MYNVEFMKCKLVKERNCQYDLIQTESDAVDLLFDLGVAESPEECVYVLCLNCRGEILSVHETAHGSINECLMPIRSIFTRALLCNAATVIVAHNHPSGTPRPSHEDLLATEKLRNAGALMAIPVLDHIILSSNKTYYSFKENGLI